MCGYIGAISKNKIDTEKLILQNKFLVCRGPDKKVELNSNLKNLFGVKNDLNVSAIFNRLAIIDLTELGDQPMYLKDRGTLILFNGEIYNHKELRKSMEQQGIKFKSNHSDSEVVLNGLSYFGIDFIKKFIGQFAIFFLDTKSMKAYLIRDRVGQKPLFYFLKNDQLKFSSNLRSLVHDEKNLEISNNSIQNYINFGVIPFRDTIFSNIFKVLPATYVEIDLSNFKKNENLYWNPAEYVSDKKLKSEEFFEYFDNAVSYRLESDVPVANFLSGGIDSTSIIKNIYEKGNDKLNTFTVKNQNIKYDESSWANQVVEKYNTNHIEEEISSNIGLDTIEEALDSFDEPYCDPSSIPSYIISKSISNYFKVAISGDGGDELLGGYVRTRELLHSRKINNNFINMIFNIYPARLGTGQNILSRTRNLQKATSSYFEDRKLMGLLGLDLSNDHSYIETGFDNYKNLLLTEYKLYLPEMMMLKIDRTSMANSLEVRSPFVDHKLIEYILSLNSDDFIKNQPKFLLKKYLSEDFSNDFLNREKKGFVFDIENWIYINQDIILSTVNDGKIIKNLNINVVNALLKVKSRANAIRLWKIFVLEKYIEGIKK
jgi:asparagine synthase (glutamine-hydrolysing)